MFQNELIFPDGVENGVTLDLADLGDIVVDGYNFSREHFATNFALIGGPVCKYYREYFKYCITTTLANKKFTLQAAQRI
jgi:hypothetical protein